MGLACRELGDAESAAMELDAAHRAFTSLGAAPDAARVEALSGKPAKPAGGLSAREGEGVRLIAAGKANRSIATELFITEKTVARHVSKIFPNLRGATPAAATAEASTH